MGWPSPSRGARGDSSGAWDKVKRTRARRSGGTAPRSPPRSYVTCPSAKCDKWEFCDELVAKEFKCKCGCQFAKGLAAVPLGAADHGRTTSGDAKARAGDQVGAAAAELAKAYDLILKNPTASEKFKERLAVLVEISLFRAEPADQLHEIPEFDDAVLVHVHRIVHRLEKLGGV